ncbi:MAG: hypothetical protein J7J52_01120 [Deltaproteobacteria bacterium]|nr:hypothetical protein [Deltaproteobacteria bacterium]
MKSKCLVCGKEIQIYPWSLAIDAICLDCRLKIWEDIIRFSEAERK